MASLLRSALGARQPSLFEALSRARMRAAEERLFLVEQLLDTLDPERRLRALSNGVYQSARPLQVELWNELCHWVGATIRARHHYGRDETPGAGGARQLAAERDRMLLDLLPQSLEDPQSVLYARKRFLWFRERLARLDAELDSGLAHGLRLLEIGPGTHAGVGALFAALGARVTLVDIAATLALDDTEYYRNLISAVERDGAFDWAGTLQLDRDRVVLSPRLEYRAPMSDGVLDLPDQCFDVAYSACALEHVRDLPGLAGELFRVLAPGGIAVHLLDLSDHRLEAHLGALTLLCLDDRAWAEVESDAGYYQSRRLAHEYCDVFEQAGFEVLELEVLDRAEVTADVRAALAGRFQGLGDDEINPIDVALVLVRPP